MSKPTTLRASRTTIVLNKVKTFFSKPHNVILLLLGIVLTFTTVAPIVAIVQDTFKIHAGTIDAHLTGQASGYTTVNYIDLFTSRMAKTNLWTPLLNTVLLAVGTCIVSILYGGLFAFLITRTDLAWRKYLSSIFIFPYIMPQWTLAVVWQNLFNSNAVTGTSNGLLAALFGINMPIWWCKGLFPSLMVLGLHYAPFAYILIGGIFRNMDANLEEAATILDTPKWKTMFRITLPMVKPAILSTILLVFGSAMGSYPVPHYLGLSTLSTKYVSMNSKYTGEASILAIIMMVFGVAIMLLNQLSLRSRKTTPLSPANPARSPRSRSGNTASTSLPSSLSSSRSSRAFSPSSRSPLRPSCRTRATIPSSIRAMPRTSRPSGGSRARTSPKTACTARRASCTMRPSGGPSRARSSSPSPARCWPAPSAR